MGLLSELFETDREQWRLPLTDDSNSLTEVTVVDGTAYTATGIVGYDSVVYAVEAATGELRWRYEGDLDYRTPTVVDGTVLVSLPISDDETPWLVSLDAATGHTRWQPPAETDAGAAGARGAATAADGVAYAPHNNGISALSADTGELLWTHGFDGGCAWSTVHDGTVYATTHSGPMGSEGYLVALDAATGQGKWRHRYRDDDITLGTTVADGRLYAGRGSGGLFAVDAATGERQWQWRPDGSEKGSSVTIADGVAHLTTGTHLIALSTDGDGSGADAAVYHQTRGHTGWNVATAAPPAWLGTTLSDQTGDTQVWQDEGDGGGGEDGRTTTDTRVYDTEKGSDPRDTTDT